MFDSTVFAATRCAYVIGRTSSSEYTIPHREGIYFFPRLITFQGLLQDMYFCRMGRELLPTVKPLFHLLNIFFRLSFRYALNPVFRSIGRWSYLMLRWLPLVSSKCKKGTFTPPHSRVLSRNSKDLLGLIVRPRTDLRLQQSFLVFIF